MAAIKGVYTNTEVPVIELKQNTVIKRGHRKSQGIAQLNAMRNKHVSFDQFRLSKRRATSTKERGSDFRIANQLSFDEATKVHKRPLSVWGRGPNSDSLNYVLKSGDAVTRSSPQLAVARSKTCSGPLFKGSAHSNSSGVVNKELSLCEIKGNSLEVPINSQSLNRNTPQVNPEEDKMATFTDDVDNSIRLPVLAKYMDASPAEESTVKLDRNLVLSVDQATGTNTVIKTTSKRFKPRKDHSKVVLKYYSGGAVKNPTNYGLVHFSENIQSAQGIQPTTTEVISSVHKDPSLPQQTADVHIVNPLSNSSRHFLENESVKTGAPVSLTTQNLELFDHLSLNIKSSKVQGSATLTDDEESLNERVITWLKEKQKAVDFGGSSQKSGTENGTDFNETHIFSSSMVYKHTVSADHF